MTLIFLTIYRLVRRASQNYTGVQVELVFNSTVPINEIPSAADILETVQNATADNSTASNVTILGGSVLVIGTELAA